MIDLHQHSTFSDGTDNVEELMKKNKAVGVKVMSITDHDNNQSVLIAKDLANDIGLTYFSGIEFSTDYNGESVHILCYGYDADDKIIHNLIEESIKLRHKRVDLRLQKLEDEFSINLGKDIIKKINDAPNPNKMMIANVLKDFGYGSSCEEIIKKYLYHKISDCKLKTVEVLKQLRVASGVSVYAHPLGGVGEKKVDREMFEERLRVFIDAGLDGIECYYSLYNKEEQNYLIKIARKHNLLISGGSDYHGKNKTVEIGELSNFGDFPTEKDVTILNKIKKVRLICLI